MRLGVLDNTECHLGVGIIVDVDVAVAVQVLDHRDARLFDQSLDQALATAWDDHINVVAQRDQNADGCAIGGVDALHALGGQASRRQRLLYQCRNRTVAVQRFGAAPQNGGVA